MSIVKIDFEDAEALAINLEEHLQYETDTDLLFWSAIHSRLIRAIKSASKAVPHQGSVPAN